MQKILDFRMVIPTGKEIPLAARAAFFPYQATRLNITPVLK